MIRLVPLLMAFLLAGCGFYTGTEKASQPTVIGSLHFTTTFCGTNGTPGTEGATTATDGTITEPGDPCGKASTGGVPGRYQGLIALRFPAGMTLPDKLTSSDGVVAERSPTYTASFGAPPTGMQIQGYITPYRDYGATDPSKTDFSASFDVPLPATTPGQPFAGPVQARVLAGYRTIDGLTGTGAEPVTCGGSTVCVSSVSPATDLSFPTRDLAVATPAATSTTAQATFPLRFAGKAAAGVTFALTATTTVPAGSAAPAHATFTPTDDQQTSEVVTVTVPAGTDPGTYDVTLTAKLGDETRSATGKVTVAPVTGPTGTVGPTGTTGPKVTATPTPTPKPTVTATPTPTVPPAKTVKKAPKSFTLALKKTGALAVKARGRLKLPKGVVRADGCAGIVKFTIGKTKKSTILTGSCTYSRTLKIKKAGSYKVTARFTGNQVLKAKAAKAKRFRAG